MSFYNTIVLKAEFLKTTELIAGDHESFKFEHRTFNAILFLAITFLFIRSIESYILNWESKYIESLYVGILCFSYYYSRFKKKHQIIFILTLLASICLILYSWKVHGGILGTTNIVIFISFFLFIIAKPKRLNLNIAFIFIVFSSALFCIEYFRFIDIDYKNIDDLKFKAYSSLLLGLSFLGILLYLLHNEFDHYRKSIADKQFIFQHLIASISEDYFMVEMNENGSIQYISPSVRNILGYTPKSFSTLQEIMTDHPDNEDANLKFGTVYEIQVYTDSKEIKWLKIDEALLFNNSNRASRHAIIQDITELKKHEEKIAKELEEERRLNNIKSQFITMVSHQFRTPMSIIRSTTEILDILLNQKAQPPLLDKVKNKTRRIYQAVDSVTEMMESLLSLNQANAGKIKFTPSSQDIVSLIESVIDKFGHTLEKHNKADLDILGDRKNISFDWNLLEHVFINLISNAYKYSPKYERPHITISFQDSYVNVIIADKGIGINSEDLKSIFQPFFRGENVENIKGTGIGLSVVKEFILLHNGKVFAESEVNKGTNFIIDLPYQLPLKT